MTSEDNKRFAVFARDGITWETPWMILENREDGIYVTGGHFGDHLITRGLSQVDLELNRVFYWPGQPEYFDLCVADYMRCYPLIEHGDSRERLKELLEDLEAKRVADKIAEIDNELASESHEELREETFIPSEQKEQRDLKN